MVGILFGVLDHLFCYSGVAFKTYFLIKSVIPCATLLLSAALVEQGKYCELNNRELISFWLCMIFTDIVYQIKFENMFRMKAHCNNRTYPWTQYWAHYLHLLNKNIYVVSCQRVFANSFDIFYSIFFPSIIFTTTNFSWFSNLLPVKRIYDELTYLLCVLLKRIKHFVNRCSPKFWVRLTSKRKLKWRHWN